MTKFLTAFFLSKSVLAAALEPIDPIVVPQVGHVQSPRRNGGSGSRAVAGVQDGSDLLRADLSLRAVDHGTGHGPGHIVEESVGADPELLHTLGLWDHRNKLPNQLSGGQQQRTAIGRAIVKNPDILLCDEPTGALDYQTGKEILKLIETVNRKYGNTVIMVTHNDAIRLMATLVVKFRDGVVRKAYRNETPLDAEELEW